MSDVSDLLEVDFDYLQRKGWQYKVQKIPFGSSFEVDIIIYKFPLPSKYIPCEVDLLLRQFPGYPDTPMDMFWTRPDVILVDSKQKPPATEVYESYLDLQWQRWSRHWNGWRSGIDTLENYIQAIIMELQK